MNEFNKAIEENGFSKIDGVKYALGQQPYFGNFGNGVAYQAYAFSEKMLDSDGSHQAGLNDSVRLVWDASAWFEENGNDAEFDCDWENCAEIR